MTDIDYKNPDIFPLSWASYQSLYNYVGSEMSEGHRHCDHTYKLSHEFMRRVLNFNGDTRKAVINFFISNGAICDCEVALKIKEIHFLKLHSEIKI